MSAIGLVGLVLAAWLVLAAGVVAVIISADRAGERAERAVDEQWGELRR